jgi:hypothetical protein
MKDSRYNPIWQKIGLTTSLVYGKTRTQSNMTDILGVSGW